MNITNNKILITGGGSGIGLAMTERFIQEGNTVIICGRRKDVLAEASSKLDGLITFECDLSSTTERERLFAWIKAEHSDLNVLVNNAGIQNWMKIEDEDFLSKAQQEIAINIEAPIHLTKMFMDLASLRTIVNVTSGLSFVPLTKVPVYSATKAFFHSFTLSLRHLLSAKNIEVVEVIPPALNTDLGGKGIHDFAPAVSGFIDAIFSQLAEGKITLTYDQSEFLANANPEQQQQVFLRMNSH